MIKTIYLKSGAGIPNNPELPVILYQGVWKEDPLESEANFNRNKWLNSWVNGVFDFHHYHSNTHEVLAVQRGKALLMLGGEEGQEAEVSAGDVLLLPAGTGHKRLDASYDFQVAGAYPNGMSADLKKSLENDLQLEIEKINNVPLPETDPVYGESGPLFEFWK
ncbi:cupin domain-containing protein [Metabacillus sp. RGM 3146]|uniref:cupin domain-containing protein n=1 Tax=Metabacillus sp. RGM 3146 TaxID=3401092 RepID=UPI003B9D93B3